MKNLLFIIVLVFLNSCAKETKPNKKTVITTYYLIRHAEKDRSDVKNKNPHLTEIGKKRAQKWATVFKNIPFDAVYTTNYHRTIETATPTAKAHHLTIQFYNPQHLYDTVFQQKTKGKTVLIVGHSNTTPYFVNKIIKKNKYKDIDDHNNANLYIVTICNNDTTDSVLKIE